MVRECTACARVSGTVSMMHQPGVRTMPATPGKAPHKPASTPGLWLTHLMQEGQPSWLWPWSPQQFLTLESSSSLSKAAHNVALHRPRPRPRQAACHHQERCLHDHCNCNTPAAAAVAHAHTTAAHSSPRHYQESPGCFLPDTLITL